MRLPSLTQIRSWQKGSPRTTPQTLSTLFKAFPSLEPAPFQPSHAQCLCLETSCILQLRPFPYCCHSVRVPLVCHKDPFRCHFLSNSFPVHLVRMNCFLLQDPQPFVSDFLHLSQQPDSEGWFPGPSRWSPPRGSGLVKLLSVLPECSCHLSP